MEKKVINTIREYDDGTMETTSGYHGESLTHALSLFKRPRDLAWLIKFIHIAQKRAEKANERWREYFLKTKAERYEYHRQYRLTHPKYEQARRKRAREHKKEQAE